MEETTNYSLVLNAILENYDAYDDEAQNRDVDLICNLLRIKYNSLERKAVSEKLINKVTDCLNKKQSWISPY